MSPVLPANVKTYAVGGAGPENFGDWLSAGITGFGIGSALYRAGFSPSDVASCANDIVASYDLTISQ
jgi:2-dehydro-3-deoxyphosphogalactonate aldolase